MDSPINFNAMIQAQEELALHFFDIVPENTRIGLGQFAGQVGLILMYIS